MIGQVTPEMNNFHRKRLISVSFIIKQLFDILGVEYKIIPITQSKNTLRYLVQSFYGKKSVNLPLIATEGFSTVLDSAMYPY